MFPPNKPEPTYFDQISQETLAISAENETQLYIIKLNNIYQIHAVSSGLDKLIKDPVSSATGYWPIEEIDKFIEKVYETELAEIIFPNNQLTTNDLSHQVLTQLDLAPKPELQKPFSVQQKMAIRTEYNESLFRNIYDETQQRDLALSFQQVRNITAPNPPYRSEEQLLFRLHQQNHQLTTYEELIQIINNLDFHAIARSRQEPSLIRTLEEQSTTSRTRLQIIRTETSGPQRRQSLLTWLTQEINQPTTYDRTGGEQRRTNSLTRSNIARQPANIRPVEIIDQSRNSTSTSLISSVMNFFRRSERVEPSPLPTRSIIHNR